MKGSVWSLDGLEVKALVTTEFLIGEWIQGIGHCHLHLCLYDTEISSYRRPAREGGSTRVGYVVSEFREDRMALIDRVVVLIFKRHNTIGVQVGHCKIAAIGDREQGGIWITRV